MGAALFAPSLIGVLLMVWAFAVDRYRPPTGMVEKPVETAVYQLIEVKLPAWVGVVAFVLLPRFQVALLRRAGQWRSGSQLPWVVLFNGMQLILPAVVLYEIMHPWV